MTSRAVRSRHAHRVLIIVSTAESTTIITGSSMVLVKEPLNLKAEISWIVPCIGGFVLSAVSDHWSRKIVSMTFSRLLIPREQTAGHAENPVKPNPINGVDFLTCAPIANSKAMGDAVQNAVITGAGTSCSWTPRTPGVFSAATRSACLLSIGSSSEIQK